MSNRRYLILLFSLFLLFSRPFNPVFSPWLFIFFLFRWEYSWTGGSFFCFNRTSWFFIYISVLVYIFIFSLEFLSGIIYLILICLCFSFLVFISEYYLILYIGVEIVVVPLLILLLGYGAQVQKVQASFYMLFYSRCCSLPGLFFFLSIEEFKPQLPFEPALIFSGVIFFLILGFLIKLPVYFLHFWLPLVHVEAPTSASIFLARVLLKLGGYCFSLFMIFFNWDRFLLYLFWGLIGIVLVGSSSVTASDTKSFAAYSSVIHMSFVFFMGSQLRDLSISSIFYVLIGHGFISSLWFFILGLGFQQSGTRIIYYWGSVLQRGFVFFFLASLVVLFNAGSPLSFIFFGDILGIFYLQIGVLYLVVLFFIYYMISLYIGLIFVLRFRGVSSRSNPRLGFLAFFLFLFISRANTGLVLYPYGLERLGINM